MDDVYSPNYSELIKDRIAKRDGTPLPNGTMGHAALLMESIFLNASKSIQILTGELNARVYGTDRIVSAARQFLADSEHQLEIVFEGPIEVADAGRHPLLAIIGYDANVKLWKVNPKFRGRLVSHFALMDDDSYRFEPDKNEPSAVAAFGDRKFADQLGKIFTALKNDLSEEFRLPVPA